MNHLVTIVLALVALASVPAIPKKQTQLDAFTGLNHGKIVGGVEADRNEFPFIVDIRRASHSCAGSIINAEWIVTAAHCALRAPIDYTLVAGDHNIDIVEGTEQTRQVVEIRIHPNYGSTPIPNMDDIAVMKVTPPFEFNDVVQPVVLPGLNFVPTAFATVIGWGVLAQGGGIASSVLMKVDVPHVNDTACNTMYSGDITSTMICYGEPGKDACQGDSGGPIVCGAEKALCGIVSWGHGCAQPGFPGVYTETSWYGEWIRTAITPTAEDPEPVVEVTTCGGRIDASSASIKFNFGSPILYRQRCVWTINTPFNSLRISLQESGLFWDDKIYVTQYSAAGPGL
ncbi:trypsin [Folsomia candida]|uniref:trypsin n=1 Tax=Folsomia candida TaxID=158441 RepID=UPI001604BB1C|nr:trypsin [Folsomia candida]